MSELPLPEWFLRWLSVDVESLEGGRAHLEFVRFPDGELGLLAILAVLAAIGAVVATYLREGRLARWKKLSLAGLRSALVLAVAAVIFYPVLEIDRARDIRAVTLLLLDDSLSFGLKDRSQGSEDAAANLAGLLGVEPAQLAQLTRADIASRVLSHPEHRILERLGESNRLEVYTFSDSLRRLSGGPEPPGGDATDPAAGEGEMPAPAASDPEGLSAPNRVAIEPRGTSTALASALQSAVEQQGGSRIAAAVVVSDGRSTDLEGLGGVAQLLRERAVPVHAVGVGDPSPPRNLRITAMLAGERVFSGDPVAVDVSIDQKGFEGEDVEVLLLDEFSPAGAPAGLPPAAERAIETTRVAFAEGEREAVARFRVELQGVGRHRLTARIEPREGETFSNDNEKTADVEVIEEASRVLLISGGPSYEYRFLQNLLRRDRRVTVSAWLMSADPDFPQEGNVSLQKLPDEAAELFKYDVVVLIDPDPDGFPGGFAQILERFVREQSGGLVFVAGEKYTVKFFHSREMEPIHDALPAVADLARAEADAGSDQVFTQEWPLVPTHLASAHDATRLSSRPERNRERWEELPGTYWSFRLRKPKPGANVLLTHSDPARRLASGPEPVLLWQYYGGGRSLLLATDETWRWRSLTEEIYDQFWMQTVRYLTEGRLSGGKRRLVQLDRETYDLGDPVRVSVLLQDENFQPVVADYQVVTVTDAEGAEAEVRLEKDPAAPGWFRGLFVPRRLGEHRVRLPEGTEAIARVEPPDIEFENTALDESALRALAGSTGGTYFPIWKAPDLPDEIPDRRQTVVTTDEPIPLWDNWFTLCLLAGLLTIEWVLRKVVRLL